MEVKESVRNVTGRLGIVGELLVFLWRRKRYWMIPMIIALLVLGLLLILASSSVVAPFIYTLF